MSLIEEWCFRAGAGGGLEVRGITLPLAEGGWVAVKGHWTRGQQREEEQ